MARPTVSSLTGAGWTQVGTSNKCTKAQGSTATLVVDTGNNATVQTGVAAVTQSSTAFISSADFTGGISTHVGAGSIPGSAPNSVDSGRNLVYYGVTM